MTPPTEAPWGVRGAQPPVGARASGPAQPEYRERSRSTGPLAFVLADLFRLDPLLCGKVEAESERGCWTWTGGAHRGGHSAQGGLYGRIRRGGHGPGTRWYVHRWVWFLFHGEIPGGYEVHHDCGNSLCLNPAHLLCLEEAEHDLIHAEEQRSRAATMRRAARVWVSRAEAYGVAA